MLLSDCRSYLLLPRFAQNTFMECLCGAVDELIRRLESRCDALPCENSAPSLAACRDDELAQIADDLGVIPYYPDLPRATRENIILKARTWTRYAGTVGAVIEMVNALLNTDSTSIDDALSDPFRYRIEVADISAVSSEINYKRFGECLKLLGHATTTPDGFTFYYEGGTETHATSVIGDVMALYDTDKLCTPPSGYATGIDGIDGTLIVFAVNSGTDSNNLHVDIIRNTATRYRIITYRMSSRLFDASDITNANLNDANNDRVVFGGMLPDGLGVGDRTTIYLSGGTNA